MANIEKLDSERREIDALFRAAIAAQRASTKASEAKAAAFNASRAKTTTLMARWKRAAEFRDLCDSRLRARVPEVTGG